MALQKRHLGGKFASSSQMWYRFETASGLKLLGWFSNYGSRVVFLWVSTYPQDPYDFSHTLELRKKERKKLLSSFPNIIDIKMLLLLVMSKSRLFIAQFVFSPVCLSIRECAQNLGKIFRARQNDWWYASRYYCYSLLWNSKPKIWLDGVFLRFNLEPKSKEPKGQKI